MKLKTAADVRAFIQNRATERPRSEVPVVQIDGPKATIRLFDAVDSWGEWWGMSAKEFADALDQIPSSVATLELLINSPGGDTFDGMAIVNMMRAHPARTVAVVQGIAASAASFIACAADETIMSPQSTMMIHDAWGVYAGNADEMLAFAAILDKTSGQMAELYAAKSGKTADEMRAIQKAETWLTAAEAVELGVADSVLTDDATDAPAVTVAAALASVDVDAFLAELDKFAAPSAVAPPAIEQEEPPTDATPAAVPREQATALLATLTLNKEFPNE